MKNLKTILIGVFTITSITLSAQNQQNNRNHNTVSKKTEAKNDKRTITVTQPSRNEAKKINTSQIKYRKDKPEVVAVRSTNKPKMDVINYNNKNYYYDSGNYYRRYNNNYVKIAPPSGLRVKVLPRGYISISINNRKYFYFEGVYYSPSNNGYIIETPPVGTIVYALPADYEKVEINGEIYYEYNGILYERIRYNGERAYEVVGYLD